MSKIHKYRLPACITFLTGEKMFCVVFMRQEQRMVDMLCEDRDFIPVETIESVHMVNRRAVVHVELLDMTKATALQDKLPPFDQRELRKDENKDDIRVRRAAPKLNFAGDD